MRNPGNAKGRAVQSAAGRGSGADAFVGAMPSAAKAPLSAEDFAAAADVSRETLDRLLAFDAALLDWNARHNLVARSTLADRWRRHFLDSAQLFPLIPRDAATFVDLGSGAGFPGLVLAAMGTGRLEVTLIESVGKKTAFLAAAAAAMGLSNVRIVADRIEKAAISPPDVLTARALAPLDALLGLAHRHCGKSTLCLFLKGQDVASELTEASKSWKMDVTRYPSATSAGSTILAIRSIAARRGAKE